jgi:hypothetical protein
MLTGSAECSVVGASRDAGESARQVKPFTGTAIE